MKQQLYICECHSTEHQMVWNSSPDENEKMIYVSIHLLKKPFLQRLKHGLKYIFGYQSRYGAFDEIILSEKHSKQLIDASYYLDPKGHEQYLENTYKAWNGILS